MYFEGYAVPGAEWVETVHICNKDGSTLSESNWRRKLIGRISLCWVTGGFRMRGLFFKGEIRMDNGVLTEVKLDASNWCSTTEAQPVEVEPGIFELITDTSIYRLRLLSEEEKNAVWDAVEQELTREFECDCCQLAQPEVPGMMS